MIRLRNAECGMEEPINQYNSEFRIPNSEFQWGNYANHMAKPALRRTNVDEEPRLHVDCRRHPQLGHWREHGDFQRDQRALAAALRFSGPGPAGVGLRNDAATGRRSLLDGPSRFR